MALDLTGELGNGDILDQIEIDISFVLGVVSSRSGGIQSLQLIP